MKSKFDELFETVMLDLNEASIIPGKYKKLIDFIAQKGERVTAIALINVQLKRKTGGIGSSDLPDTPAFANGITEIEDILVDTEYEQAVRYAGDVAEEMLRDEGFGIDFK